MISKCDHIKGMGQNITITICMPVFNVEKYVATAIESCITQGYKNWELIIIDDGSTDRSGLICDTYAEKDSRIKVIHKQNQGQLFARKDGIESATGDYIVFLDSDDYLEECALDELVSVVKNNDIDVVFYLLNIVNADKITKRNISFSPGMVSKEAVLKSVLSCDELNSLCTKMIKTQLLKADPLDYNKYAKCSYGEDKLQSLYALTEAEKFYFLPSYLYNYRVNFSSVTYRYKSITEIDNRIQADVWNVLREYMSKWDMVDSDSLERYYAYRTRNLVDVFSSVYYLNCNKKEVFKIGWRKYVLSEMYNYKSNKYISKSDKLKFWCMLHKKVMPLFVYSKIKHILYR